MKTADFDFELPEALIAQEALAHRAASRMMVLGRASGEVSHRAISELPGFLEPGDLLVLNDTRVFPARLIGSKEGSGGKVELLFLEPVGDGVWDALCKTGRRPRQGSRLIMADGRLRLDVVAVGDEGRLRVRIPDGVDLVAFLDTYGIVPLPPYIRRDLGADGEGRRDLERYQTVYAREAGSVAAPTAGLHFDDDLFAALDGRGVARAYVTLHVGIGTFRPVKVENLDDHTMHEERYVLSQETVDAIAETRARGGRIVAVGTTTVRTLETVAAAHGGQLVAGSGASRLFIRPPYAFRVIDGLLTNFHLPKSTLLMMICALAGHEPVMAAYRAAVQEKYRFFSYGDCMLII